MTAFCKVAFLVSTLSCLLAAGDSLPLENEYWRAIRRGIHGEFGRLNPGITSTPDRYQFGDQKLFSKGGPRINLVLAPVANAISIKGAAIANPVSQVIVDSKKHGTIVHNPLAVAVVGPGGIAHAQLRTSIQYLPFYGGAKGQYLEVTKDSSGSVVKEKIVSEETISSENIVKNVDENLLSKVLAATLQQMQRLSSSLLKLHNIGRRTESLRRADKVQFKEQLATLGETSSNLIKLIDEIGDDVDMLFKKNATGKKQFELQKNEDVGEEGMDEGSNTNIDELDELGEVINAGGSVADSRPVGLAVVGESGLAASRPHATAVAASGLALARPIATAIAGLDPTLLGIDFQINKVKKPKAY